MLTVLLADDNKFALSHFSGLVDWESLGFHLAGTAIDGIEAWEEVQRLHPNLVITDVQMPGIDGRELARRIKKFSPDTMVIFLSSYDEFDYARAAIDLSVQDYILKQELDKITLEKKLIKIRQELTNQINKRRRLARSYLTSYFHLPTKDQDIEFLQDFFYEKFDFFILEQDHIPEMLSTQSGIKTKEVDYHSLISLFSRSIPEVFCLVRFEPYRWVGLTTQHAQYEALGMQAKTFLETQSKESFSLFLYKGPLSIIDCKQEYEKYLFLFEQRYFEKTSAVLYADLYERPGHQELPSLDAFCSSLEDSSQDASLCLDNLFLPLLYSYDFHGVMELTRQILTEIERKISRTHTALSLYDEEIYHLLTIRRIIRWLKNKVSDCVTPDNQFQSENIAKAVSYIYQEYPNPMLSVEEIARASSLSVNRLNDLFKKELGDTVGRFLTKIRMEKAKELLTISGNKIPEVAAKTGYNSPSYFSHVFHKFYGISPQEYQKRRIHET